MKRFYNISGAVYLFMTIILVFVKNPLIEWWKPVEFGIIGLCCLAWGHDSKK